MNNTDQQAFPQPPPIQRQIRLYPFQYVGIFLLLILPILALFGVFGESFTTIEQSNNEVAVTVDYATRYRYKMINSMTVSVQNLTDAELPVLTILFDRRYIDQFSTVSFSPAEARITDSAYEVELQNLASGDIQIVRVELQGERYGSHKGVVAVDAEGIELLEIAVKTIIFP